ncbi:MAG: hypothetical protein K2P37_09100 [Oscillospiraceae bacterium]|nr:hypothetical protein [Oscillospiraceae bacterium]
MDREKKAAMKKAGEATKRKGLYEYRSTPKDCRNCPLPKTSMGCVLHTAEAGLGLFLDEA